MKTLINFKKNYIRNTIKGLSVLILWLAFFNISLANFDLEITDISLSNGWDVVSMFSIPKINITIKNNNSPWLEVANNSWTIPDWFISCIEITSQNEVFRSSPMATFIVQTWTSMIAWNLELKDTLTQLQRTVKIECYVNKDWNFDRYFDWSDQLRQNNTAAFTFSVDKLWRFDAAMDRSIDPIRKHLDAAEPNSTQWWWDSIRSFVFNKITSIIIPIIIIVGILMGIIWWYRLFFSTSEDETKKGIQLVIYGVIWIIIILSSKYIWNVIFVDLFQSGDASWINWVELAMQIYENIAYPFIKVVVYLALWVMFVILSGKVFSFLTNTDGTAQKKAWTMIAWSSISMLIIIWAKQIVEAIYGKQNEVMNQSAETLWDIWSWILANKSIPILYSVINWVMWLTSLVVLIIILVQTFKILMDPDNAENRQKMGKSILYIFIGILIIGAGYLITNFLVIN